MLHRNPPIVIIHETNGNWSGLLRRQLLAGEVSVVRVDNINAMDQELRSTARRWSCESSGGPSPYAIRACLVVQVDEQVLCPTLDWLRVMQERYPLVRCFAIPAERIDPWPLYEAGAALVIHHPLQILPLARIVRRYFSLSTESTSTTGTEITAESVWLSLPWSDHATPDIHFDKTF